MVSQRERVAVDLVDTFPSAEKRTSLPSLHRGFEVVDDPAAGGSDRCIQALPSSRITWAVTAEPGMILTVRVGMRPDTWSWDGDGAMFRIGVAAQGGYQELRRVYFNPAALPGDRRFDLLRFDLSRFGNQQLNIVFSTDPGLANSPANDVPLWCAPRITSG